MAICLHKLINRVSVISPILNQGRQFSALPIIGLDQVSANVKLIFVVFSSFRINSITPINFDEASSPNQSSSNGGASEEQLSEIYETLRECLPHLFVSPLDYSKVHKDIVFENRIRGKTYYGIVDYVKQMSFLRLYGHFKYAYVKLDVLKMTQHTEDSSIKVRWQRIVKFKCITGYRIFFKMLQFRVCKTMIEQHQLVWIDGFSTFYVNNEGYIVRHIAEKVIPDEDKQLNPIEKVVNKLGEVPKLALVVKLSTDIGPSAV